MSIDKPFYPRDSSDPLPFGPLRHRERALVQKPARVLDAPPQRPTGARRLSAARCGRCRGQPGVPEVPLEIGVERPRAPMVTDDGGLPEEAGAVGPRRTRLGR